jgi:hypothetical protein
VFLTWFAAARAREAPAHSRAGSTVSAKAKSAAKSPAARVKMPDDQSQAFIQMLAERMLVSLFPV